MWEGIHVWESGDVGSALLPVLLDVAVKATVILLLAALATRLLRRSAAATRHVIWVLAASSLVVLPALTMVVPGWQALPGWMNPSSVIGQEALLPEEPSAGPVAASASSGEVSSPRLSTRVNQVPRDGAARVVGSEAPGSVASARQALGPAMTFRQVSLSTIVCLVWLIGGAGVLVRMSLGVLSLLILGRTAQPVVDEEWIDALEQTREDLGVRREVRLLQSRRRAMPMVWGIVRPRLLVPAEACGWPAERRRVVLLHELAHVKRWDCLWQLLMQAVCAVYWFHPLAWLAQRAMQVESEQACDDLVLAAGPRASDYAEHILQIASGLRADRLSGAAAIAMARPSRLEGRLLAILDATRSRRGLTRAAMIAAVALVAGVVVPVAMLRAGNSAETSRAESPAETMKTAATQVAADVEPQLRFLAWCDEGRKPGEDRKAWYPDGLLVRDETGRRLLRSVPGTAVGGRPADERYVCLWFSHPQVDQTTYQRVRLVDAAGQLVPQVTRTVRDFSSVVYPADIVGTQESWMVYALSPGVTGQIPETVTVVLDYGLGPWTERGKKIPPDYSGLMVLNCRATLGSIGQDTDGKTFVTIVREDAEEKVQVGFRARMKNGKEIIATSHGRFDSVERFEFDVPLSQVVSFEELHRPIRTAVYEKVRLVSGGPAATQATGGAVEKGSSAGAATQPAPGENYVLRLNPPLAEGWWEKNVPISFRGGRVVLARESGSIESTSLSAYALDEGMGVCALAYGKQIPLKLKVGRDASSLALEIPSVEFGRKDDMVICSTEVLCRSSTKDGWEVALESLDAGGRVLANNRMVLFAGERQETEPPLRSEALMASLPVPEGAEPAGFRVFVRPAGERVILESSGQAGGRWGSQSQPAKVRPNVGRVGTSADAIPANAVMLSHVAESSKAKRSIAGTGQAVLFDRPAGAGEVVAVQLYASRYGTLAPPKEDFHIYLLDENRKVLVDVPVPYAAVPRGQMQWYTFRVPPTAVPEQFYVATFFSAEQTKGVYLGLDPNVEESHSFIGLPEDGYGPMEETEPYDWMIRVYLVPGDAPAR